MEKYGILNAKEVASLLGVTSRSILSMLNSGELKGRKICKQWFINVETLKAYIDEGEGKQAPKEMEEATPEERASYIAQTIKTGESYNLRALTEDLTRATGKTATPRQIGATLDKYCKENDLKTDKKKSEKDGTTVTIKGEV